MWIRDMEVVTGNSNGNRKVRSSNRLRRRLRIRRVLLILNMRRYVVSFFMDMWKGNMNWE